jgi:hypothetical protein
MDAVHGGIMCVVCARQTPPRSVGFRRGSGVIDIHNPNVQAQPLKSAMKQRTSDAEVC